MGLHRAIKEAENRGIIETVRSRLIRVKSKKAVLEHLTFEIVEVPVRKSAGKKGWTSSTSLSGAMTEEHILDYVSEGGLSLWETGPNIQRLALQHDNAVQRKRWL